jgi:antirestriction protein ArdC
MMNRVYEIITARILEKLSQGIIPWKRPWKTHPPANLITGKPYRGVNILLLSCSGFDSPYWLTFLQAKELGGYVSKGEKASIIVFWKRLAEAETEEGEQETSVASRKYRLRPVADNEVSEAKYVLRYYSVFNTDQCQSIKHQRLVELLEDQKSKISNDTAASISFSTAKLTIERMPQPPSILFQGDRACYNMKEDRVVLPSEVRFESKEAFYSTLFHELVHSTGHQSRLARKTLMETSMFTDHSYTKEELVAEIGAAFLTSYSGFLHQTLDNHVAYLQSWIAALSNDSKMIVQAASHAQKAVDFILDRSQIEE